jgi:hypothetical protein
MNDHITAASYVVCNNEAIWGVGETEDMAWTDFVRQMENANILIVSWGGEPPDDGSAWTRGHDYRVRPATAALLAQVEAEGGNIGWREAGGVACTVAESEEA